MIYIRKIFSFRLVLQGLLMILFISILKSFEINQILLDALCAQFPDFSKIIVSFYYGVFGLFFKLGLKGIIEYFIDYYNNMLYLGMDNSDSNPESKNSGSGSSHKYPKSATSSDVKTSENSDVKSSKDSDEKSSSSNQQNKSDESAQEDVKQNLPPLEGIPRSLQKLDAIFDRQINQLNDELVKLNIKLEDTKDESSIKNLREDIDRVHGHLAFVQSAKVDSLREIQQLTPRFDTSGGESSLIKNKRKASSDSEGE